MNKLKITLNEDGSVRQFTPDFKIMRGSYRNVLVNIEVPYSLLINPVDDVDDGTSKTGNNVRVAAIITTATGKHLQTKKYEFQRVKEFTRNNVEYRLYQRKMPKEFTMWETVNALEAAQSGELNLVINVINWVKNELNAKIEEVSASPTFALQIYPSAFLEGEEEIEEPSAFDELHSQVQEIDTEVDNIKTDLYGEDGKSLGDYLKSRLKAGNKILLKQSGEQVEISVETIKAGEVIIETIPDLKATNVQEALLELSRRTDSQQVDTVRGESEYLVDNTDPRNPIIKHDTSKVDNTVFDDAVTTLNSKINSEKERAESAETANANEIASINQKLKSYALISGTGAVVELDIDTTSYLMTLNLKNANGEVLSSDTIDFPLETMVVNASYKKGTLTLVLKNGNTLDIDISSIIDGLVNSTEFDDLKNEVANTKSLLATETSDRESADQELQSKIDQQEIAINSLTNSKLDNVTIEGGTNNGTIKVTKKIGDATVTTDNIPITGLGSAAFKEATEFATAEQGELAETAVQTETDPTVPDWAKQATKPTYTAEEVGAMPSNTQFVSSVNGNSGAITGIATETYVDSAIATAIGNAMGGEY